MMSPFLYPLSMNLLVYIPTWIVTDVVHFAEHIRSPEANLQDLG